MRLANLNGRAVLVTDEGVVDVATASNGAFSSDVDKLLGHLDQLVKWLSSARIKVSEAISPDEFARNPLLGPVIKQPGQVFAIGLNYRTHAAEMGLALPGKPMVFTKFPSSVTGANASFSLPSEHTDWEAELVVVFGKRGRDVSVEDANSYIAGYCVGQDLSDRELQLQGSPAQFSLGKSYENFAPIGPWITTIDDIPHPNSLSITCDINGVRRQDSHTSDMAFTVPELVSYISAVCEIRPGDIMFTGSPHGVGQGQIPPLFLKPGDVVETSIEGLGSLRNVARARG
jgi:2-keto-4-pentenoate hydratase/2-oxohepta-3-ene-1,7-dioic acid hydratase in catechol pathway